MSWWERKWKKTLSTLTASDLSDVIDSTAFTPVWSCGGSMVFNPDDPTVNYAHYQQVGDVIYFTISADNGDIDVSSGASNLIYFTIPIGITTGTGFGACWIKDGNGDQMMGACAVTTSNRILLGKMDSSNFTAGANFSVRIFGRALKS